MTELLTDLERAPGSREAVDGLYAVVYDELRSLAHHLMRSQRPEHTLQPTALVHEAYLKLVNASQVRWEGRAHFFRVAARAMRQILVNHAEARATDKRGGDWTRISLDEDVAGKSERILEILDLNDALERLARNDARMAQVVEYRVFAGMPAREVAHVLGVSKRTVDADWKVAKLWLADELRGPAA